MQIPCQLKEKPSKLDSNTKLDHILNNTSFRLQLLHSIQGGIFPIHNNVPWTQVCCSPLEAKYLNSDILKTIYNSLRNKLVLFYVLKPWQSEKTLFAEVPFKNL